MPAPPGISPRPTGRARRSRSSAGRSPTVLTGFASGGVLDDPSVGAAGPFGLATDDWRDFKPVEVGEVMALEYLVSVRRRDIARIGEMDRAFRFYRNLDIDYSRQVVAAGLELRRYPS